DLTAFAEGVRREAGLADYAVRPAGAREEYFPIVYLEPLDGRNRGALGFDMFSEPVRRAAMERARDTGAPAASGRVTLVQEETEREKQSGFLIYVPVYRGGAVPPTVEERRAALVGFVYSPFRAGDLLRGIFGQEPNPVADFSVYDGAAADPAGLLHGPAGGEGREPRFTSTRTFDVEGRPWTLAFFTRPEIELASGGWVVSLVLAGGALFGVVLFFIARAQGRARREAERAAAESRASEARFRTLVEQSPVSTQIFSPDGRTVRVNRAWEELWGVTLEALGGYNILEDPQLEEKGIAPYIRRGFAGEALAIPAILYDPEQTIPGKTTHPDPRRWVSAVIYPVRDERGRVREVVLMHEDITEQRRAEERLRESHAEVKDILESISDAFYAVDAEWRFTYVNRRAEELWGRRREDLVGRSLWDEFPEAVGSRVHEELLRAAAGRRPVNFETLSPILDRWLEVSAYPTGRGLSVYFRDITARKRAEEEREQLLGREREARERAEGAEGRAAFLASASAALDSSLEYETTLETVAHLAVPALADYCFFDLVAPGGRIQRVAWKHKDPETNEEFDGVWRSAPPRDLGDDAVARALRTGRTEFVPEVTEEWLRAAAGGPDHFEFMRRLRAHSLLTVVLAAREQTIGALTFCLVEPARKFTPADVATAEDLARRAALAVSNARLYREAQEANRLKDEFLATLSHELRTPLTSVLGWAKLLRTESFDPKVTARALEAIERNAAAQTRLINDLLDVSRIVTGKLRLNVAPVELAPVVEAAVESLRPAAEARGVLLRLALEGQPGPVAGDADRLQQVVWNLLSNAIKFTPHGRSVEVRLAGRDGHAELAVADEGAGIAPEFLPHVFERFRQADGAITREHGGLGLGLAIVRHLVELHGGRVRAESEGHGRGATFTVTLPLLRNK
ncbi:MAG TPA: CHASE domain-containing protein, partial [Pyrinomonadaceae bacterium]|nr:CHASE domain-containing protein [Pyrinomonadaceae bacterium]